MQDALWKRTPEWFKPWFNTEAYHVLYGHRSEQEAHAFADNLAEAKLLGSPGALLDAGCGSGRHARAFAKHGWNVTGMDLSPNSIDAAKAESSATDEITYVVGDVRKLHQQIEWGGRFDAVTSLFTSIGYFESDTEHLDVFRGFEHVLQPGGHVLIDFLNAPAVLEHLVEHETIEKEGVTFTIHRRHHEGWIEKSIQFEWRGEASHHVERVRALDQSHFKQCFDQAGLELVHVCGDALLQPWTQESPRLIVLGKKPIPSAS